VTSAQTRGPKLNKTRAEAEAKAKAVASHVYGPVPSRRLGFSLGVDILPHKTCSFDCVYCQLGRTKKKTVRRAPRFSARQILKEVRRAVAAGRRIDRITFSGSGEPTLNTQLGRLIREIKEISAIPVVVLTNSSLLGLSSVRRALRPADIVVPSLDAASAPVFRRVNRPHPSVRVEDVIAGLEKFRREFRGQIWLEVMLVKGVNDAPEDIAALKLAIRRIQPDKVQLNTVVRPPAESWAKPLGRRALERIRKELGGPAEVVADFRKRQRSGGAANLRQEILAMVERRPVTVTDMALSLGCGVPEIRRQLRPLLRWRRVRPVRHKRTVYYEPQATSSQEK
jgi:wyosine [tRNA(Phe)-imidazoG37] synthetase (radical SAM superfamily)